MEPSAFDDREAQPLDGELSLEPVTGSSADPLLGGDPIVRDVRGRTWRVRRRRIPPDLLGPPALVVAACLLAALLVLALVT